MSLSRNVILSTGLACVLALGTLGCSTSTESTTTTEVSVTDEDGVTTTTTSETTTTSSSDEGDSTETTTTTSKTIDINGWVDAWMGTSSTGFNAYYAQAPEGTNQAMIVVFNPDTEEFLSVIGNYEVLEQGVVKITDVADENISFTIIATEQTEDHVTLDLGPDYGTAQLDTCAMDELVDAIKQVDTEGVVFGAEA